MCATDLDLELEIIEGEQAPDPGPQPAGGQAPGVAWGAPSSTPPPDERRLSPG